MCVTLFRCKPNLARGAREGGRVMMTRKRGDKEEEEGRMWEKRERKAARKGVDGGVGEERWRERVFGVFR